MPILSNATFLKVIGGMIACLFVIGIFKPQIVREDNVVEWATALVFLAAALVAGWLAARPGTPRTGLDRTATAGMAAFAGLLSLSELSFGARLFGLEMPAMDGGGEFDGGHDVVIWALRKIDSASPASQQALAAVAGLGVAAATVWVWHKDAWLYAGVRRLWEHPVRFRFSVAIILLACGVILDLLTRYPSDILEEVVELAASIALLMTVTAVAGSAQSFTVWRQDLRPAA